MEFKLGLVTQETETRMRIAELAAQLLQLTSMGGVVTMTAFIAIYRELCNEILETLIVTKDEVIKDQNVVPPVQQRSSDLSTPAAEE